MGDQGRCIDWSTEIITGNVIGFRRQIAIKSDARLLRSMKSTWLITRTPPLHLLPLPLLLPLLRLLFPLLRLLFPLLRLLFPLLLPLHLLLPLLLHFPLPFLLHYLLHLLPFRLPPLLPLTTTFPSINSSFPLCAMQVDVLPWILSISPQTCLKLKQKLMIRSVRKRCVLLFLLIRMIW